MLGNSLHWKTFGKIYVNDIPSLSKLNIFQWFLVFSTKPYIPFELQNVNLQKNTIVDLVGKTKISYSIMLKLSNSWNASQIKKNKVPFLITWCERASKVY